MKTTQNIKTKRDCIELTTKVDPRAVRVKHTLFVSLYLASLSDVCRRQILTTKVDPRAVRVNIFLLAVDP